MLSFLQALIIKLAIARYALGLLGSLAVALPLAGLLKVIGIPLMVILGIVLLPVLMVLLVVGLPIFMVLLGGIAIVGFIAVTLAFGLIAVKIALFVVLPIALVVWLVRLIRRGGRVSTAA